MTSHFRYDVHDDDIAEGLPCAWVEHRTTPPQVVPARIARRRDADDIRRSEDGFVSGFYSLSETGNFGRTFSRYPGEPFLCGRFTIILGTHQPTTEQIALIRSWFDGKWGTRDAD